MYMHTPLIHHIQKNYIEVRTVVEKVFFAKNIYIIMDLLGKTVVKQPTSPQLTWTWVLGQVLGTYKYIVEHV